VSAGSGEPFGPYLVYEQLGVGGMASVHRAIAHGIAGFQREVALKRMLPSVAENAELVKSFVREARLASYLRHANVAQTYELGKVGDVYFIAMELIAGVSLHKILKNSVAMQRPVPISIALYVVNQLCDALDYAHNLCDETGQPLGIIHRDVSPSNVIVADSGVVKLIDFGIAGASAADLRTMSGQVKGKFGYMAPEYLATGKSDARADLFAVGVIAHELLANRQLFQCKEDMQTLMKLRDMPILPPSADNPKVPPELDDIIITALQRDPTKRWQNATALRTAMTTVTKRLGLFVTAADVVTWMARGWSPDSDPEISISAQTPLPRAMPLGTVQLDAQGSRPLPDTPIFARPSTPMSSPPPVAVAPPPVAVAPPVVAAPPAPFAVEPMPRVSIPQPLAPPPPAPGQWLAPPRVAEPPPARRRVRAVWFVVLLLLVGAVVAAIYLV
jgi:serine/threonine protein kinase